MTNDLLLSFLNSHDAPCPVCDYNLRGLKTNRCPECSALLHLSIGSENTRLGPFLVAVLSFALAIGFDSVVATLISAGLLLSPPRSPLDFDTFLILDFIFLALALTCAALMLTLIKLRRRFFTLTPKAQWRFAIILFISVFITHAIAGLIMSRWIT